MLGTKKPRGRTRKECHDGQAEGNSKCGDRRVTFADRSGSMGFVPTVHSISVQVRRIPFPGETNRSLSPCEIENRNLLTVRDARDTMGSYVSA